ncbi:hypothetical protein C8J56DRAFT_928661 [Mycena floridula]|nr:hypothetical protein C8J56DRAFT_928661 [Mycena floridula]
MSIRNDRIRFVAMIKAHDGVSDEEFRTRINEVVGQVAAVPVFHKNVLKYELSYRIAGGHVEVADALSVVGNHGEYNAMVIVEAENYEKLIEALQHPDVLKALDGGFSNTMRRDDCPVFTTELLTAIDK